MAPRDLIDRIVAEARAKWPDRRIEIDCPSARPLTGDAIRLGQALSNLVENALAHGARDGAVRVLGHPEDRGFAFAVANSGNPIPADARARLFKPFERGTDRSGEGLGLGLYIASEIARAHGGTLAVSSDERETRFTLRIPA
jgi:signal transduction histidine kinase